MRLVFDPKALEHLRFWTETDRRKALQILDLIDATAKNPFEGIGKPEPLRFDLAGAWSRRIDQEHRLVYRIEKDELRVLSCRYHHSSIGLSVKSKNYVIPNASVAQRNE